MVAISFTEFRRNAKKYFDKVERGEVVRVLRHGKVIAEVAAPMPKKKSLFAKSPRLVIPGVSLSKAVLEERHGPE